MENTEHTKYTRTMLLVLAFILLIASVIGYMASGRIRTNQNSAETRVTNTPSTAPTLIPYPVQGTFSFKEEKGRTSLPMGTTFTLDLVATSSKDTVAGYDAILSYDTAAFDRQMVRNNLNTFRMFTFNRANHLSISATKNLQSTEAVRFANTSILSFTFTAKKKGTFVFSLKAIGNESSKLVNETAQVTYPEPQDFHLEIN
jgi:hypothetical protein